MDMVGKRLNELGPPAPDRNQANVLNAEIIRETSYGTTDELSELVRANLSLLTDKQKQMLLTLTRAIMAKQGGLFFIDAPGGTGKTFCINLLLPYVRSRGKIILATASSGIAATLMPGGRVKLCKSALHAQLRIRCFHAIVQVSI